MAKEFNLEAHNRDRGGAQHEMGDIEIENRFYGCKRRKTIATWVKPEKWALVGFELITRI
jgi:hypothetical protein